MHRLNGFKPSFCLGKSTIFNQGEKSPIRISVWPQTGGLTLFSNSCLEYFANVLQFLWVFSLKMGSLLLITAFMYTVRKLYIHEKVEGKNWGHVDVARCICKITSAVRNSGCFAERSLAFLLLVILFCHWKYTGHKGFILSHGN